MGNQPTKQEVLNKTITNVIVDIMTKDVQDCMSAMTADQILSISGEGITISGIKMDQAMSIDMSCLQSAEKNSELQNSVLDQVSAQLKAEAAAGFGPLTTKSDQEIQNIVEKNISSKVSVETVQDCSASAMAKQAIYIEGRDMYITDISMEQTLDTFKECAQSAVSKIVQDSNLGTDIGAEAMSKEQTMIGEFAGALGLGAMGPVIMIVILVIVGIVVLGILVGGIVGISFAIKGAVNAKKRGKFERESMMSSVEKFM